MRRYLAAALALALVAAAPPARPGQPADAIRAVIVAQLNALGANDLEAAYAHASPMIQRRFPSPAIFGRMVRDGYPMIWRPAQYRLRGLVEDARGIVQPVEFTDRTGRVYEALYEMLEIDGTWRINGVYVRELPGVGS